MGNLLKPTTMQAYTRDHRVWICQRFHSDRQKRKTTCQDQLAQLQKNHAVQISGQYWVHLNGQLPSLWWVNSNALRRTGMSGRPPASEHRPRAMLPETRMATVLRRETWYCQSSWDSWVTVTDSNTTDAYGSDRFSQMSGQTQTTAKQFCSSWKHTSKTWQTQWQTEHVPCYMRWSISLRNGLRSQEITSGWRHAEWHNAWCMAWWPLPRLLSVHISISKKAVDLLLLQNLSQGFVLELRHRISQMVPR